MLHFTYGQINFTALEGEIVINILIMWKVPVARLAFLN